MKPSPYSKYKKGGTDWLGEVPEHWQTKRLKMCVQHRDRKVEADAEEPLPYVGMENIESWTGQLSTIDLGVVPTGTANAFKTGNTLFGKLRPYLAKACNPEFDGLCSTELLVLKGVQLDRRNLLYSLLSDGFIKLVDSSTFGSKMPRANWDFIGNCVLPVPPPNEQRAIADFLRRETARLDTLVGKKRELIEKLKEKRTALISRTVTKGLPAEAAAKAGLTPHPKLKPSGIEWLGDIPEHWNAKPLRHLATRIQTGSTPPTAEEKYYEDGRVAWFGPGSFDDAIILTQPVKLLNRDAIKDGAARLFRKGATFIVTIGATLGKVSSIEDDASCNQQITVIEVEQAHVHPRFITYQLKRLESALRAIAPAATLPILSQGEIAQLALAVPEKKEQAEIADYLDRETAKLDRLMQKVEAAIEKLQEYCTALITAAVTGKIDVRGAGNSPASTVGSPPSKLPV